MAETHQGGGSERRTARDVVAEHSHQATPLCGDVGARDVTVAIGVHSLHNVVTDLQPVDVDVSKVPEGLATVETQHTLR